MAEPFRNEIDFAFFVVNFGYTKDDYESLTKREIAFIKKAWENKLTFESSIINRAVHTAVYNVNRGKGKRAMELWDRARHQEITKDRSAGYKSLISHIETREREKGKDWVKRLYQANGRIQNQSEKSI